MRALAWGAALVCSLVLATGADGVPTNAKIAPIATGSAQPLPVSGADFLVPSGAPAPSPTPASSAPPRAAPVAPKASAPARPPAPAPPRIVVESTQQSLINRDRAANGLPPLTWNSCLYNVAVANARRMAAQEYISHTNGVYSDLACGIGGRSGENVGYWSAGINDSEINNLFMASADHRANILGPYHYVATAWAVGANGYGYIAVEFD